MKNTIKLNNVMVSGINGELVINKGEIAMDVNVINMIKLTGKINMLQKGEMNEQKLIELLEEIGNLKSNDKLNFDLNGFKLVYKGKQLSIDYMGLSTKQKEETIESEFTIRGLKIKAGEKECGVDHLFVYGEDNVKQTINILKLMINPATKLEELKPFYSIIKMQNVYYNNGTEKVKFNIEAKTQNIGGVISCKFDIINVEGGKDSINKCSLDDISFENTMSAEEFVELIREMKKQWIINELCKTPIDTREVYKRNYKHDYKNDDRKPYKKREHHEAKNIINIFVK